VIIHVVEGRRLRAVDTVADAGAPHTWMACAIDWAVRFAGVDGDVDVVVAHQLKNGAMVLGGWSGLTPEIKPTTPRP
jgi:hypothetical protein